MVEGNCSAWGDLGKLLTSLNQSLIILNWGLTITIVSKLVSFASIYHLAKLPLALLPGIFLKLPKTKINICHLISWKTF